MSVILICDNCGLRGELKNERSLQGWTGGPEIVHMTYYEIHIRPVQCRDCNEAVERELKAARKQALAMRAIGQPKPAEETP